RTACRRRSRRRSWAPGGASYALARTGPPVGPCCLLAAEPGCDAWRLAEHDEQDAEDQHDPGRPLGETEDGGDAGEQHADAECHGLEHVTSDESGEADASQRERRPRQGGRPQVPPGREGGSVGGRGLPYSIGPDREWGRKIMAGCRGHPAMLRWTRSRVLAFGLEPQLPP